MSHVVIVSARIGAGHDGAAADLARRLTGRGCTVDRYDLVDLLPAPIAAALTRGYHHQLAIAPWSWQATVTAFHHPVPAAVAARATRAAERHILAAVRPDTVAVVATYPLASQALARLRRTGRLAVPAFAYLTDPSVHRTWIGAGIDTYLTPYATARDQARRLGATDVRIVAPTVSPGFRPARDAAETAAARRAHRLPPTGPLALVVAGSLGVGRPDRTAYDIAATGLAAPVVLCGRHPTLYRRLTAVPGIVALGWVDDMPTLLRAVDVAVHNAGGLTALEALATGLPAVTYRPLPGHGRANARTLDEAGIVPWIRGPRQLPDALGAALAGGGDPPDLFAAPDPAAVVTAPAADRTAHPTVRLARRRRAGHRPPTRSRV
ncbi:MAG TPA: glycosyltransferase [Actinocatenispora sp.]